MAPTIKSREEDDSLLGPEVTPIVIAVPTVVVSLVILVFLITCLVKRRTRRRSNQNKTPEDASASVRLNPANNEDEDTELPRRSGNLRRDWKEWEANLRRNQAMSLESHPALCRGAHQSTLPGPSVPLTSATIAHDREPPNYTK